MALFTVVCDFDGGTYISQVRADDECLALVAWAAELRRNPPGPNAFEEIARQAATSEEPPIALEGLSGVWCWTGLVDDKLVLTNIIRSA